MLLCPATLDQTNLLAFLSISDPPPTGSPACCGCVSRWPTFGLWPICVTKTSFGGRGGVGVASHLWALTSSRADGDEAPYMFYSALSFQP